MNRKLICIGGTGQMVLHWYLQLYLLGAIKESFEAVVIDTDDIINSVHTAKNFFATLQYGNQPNRAFGEEIPEIKLVKLKPPEGDTVYHALSGVRNWDDKNPHPAQAFFNYDTLNQKMLHGLFARPAISSVVAHNIEDIIELRPDSNSTVVVAGSIIGGTGGGLTAPVLDAIAARISQENIRDVKIRPILFGEYFPPDQSRGIDTLRLQSNQTLVLQSIKESLSEVHSFFLVGGPGFPMKYKRNPEDEKAGSHISWPEEDKYPTWEGAQAVNYLFKETVKAREIKFEEKEMDEFQHQVSIKEARATLEKRIGFVEKLIRKEAVPKMTRDPFAQIVWGRGIVHTLAHFWNIAAEVAGGKERVQDFPDRLQTALEKIWHGDGQQEGIEKIFPKLTISHKVPPRLISKMKWPEAQQGVWHKKLFPDADETARRGAATLLFKSLREGR